MIIGNYYLSFSDAPNILSVDEIHHVSCADSHVICIYIYMYEIPNPNPFFFFIVCFLILLLCIYNHFPNLISMFIVFSYWKQTIVFVDRFPDPKASEDTTGNRSTDGGWLWNAAPKRMVFQPNNGINYINLPPFSTFFKWCRISLAHPQ